MELLLEREIFTNESTIGRLSVDGVQRCYILENPLTLNPELGPEHIAISEGRFEVVITFSNRFKRPLPLLIGVPGRTAIRIHPGNTEKDTHGCQLPGVTKGENVVYRSVEAFGSLFAMIESALKHEKVFITIKRKESAALNNALQFRNVIYANS